MTHFMDILPIILSFSGGKVSEMYHDTAGWADKNRGDTGCDTDL